MSTKHTPTPWKLLPNKQYITSESSERTIARTGLDRQQPKQRELDSANAAHIVKCVNLHDELITILESISLNGHIKNEHLQNNVEKLLKRAKGGSND